MNENNNNNNVNEEVEQIEITKANAVVPISARVFASDKKVFKEEMTGTDSEKLRKLIEVYEKHKESEDNFDLNKEMSYIQKAVDTIVSNLNAINRNINQHETYLQEKYVEGFGEQLRDIESRLETEEILQARIVNLENANQSLLTDKEKNEIKINELDKKIVMLEQENNKYIALNSEIVNKENNYINQLRDLETENNKKLIELEESYKAKLQELQNKLEQANKKYSDDIAEADKEKSVMETKIDSLQENIEGLKTEKDNLNTDMKELREQHKAEIKAKETGYKQEIKLAEDKLEIERKALDDKMKELRNQHKTELESTKDEYKENIKSLEYKVSEAQDKAVKMEIEVAKIQAKLESKMESESNLKAELDVLREKLRIAEEENKNLKEETKKEDK